MDYRSPSKVCCRWSINWLPVWSEHCNLVGVLLTTVVIPGDLNFVNHYGGFIPLSRHILFVNGLLIDYLCDLSIVTHYSSLPLSREGLLSKVCWRSVWCQGTWRWRSFHQNTRLGQTWSTESSGLVWHLKIKYSAFEKSVDNHTPKTIILHLHR